MRSPACVRSPSVSSVSTSKITVPIGTTTSSVRRRRGRCSRLLPPGSPLARLEGALIAEIRERVEARLGDEVDVPPPPPSPPSGPPNGMNFSRRKLTMPRPPLPAWTLIAGFVDEFHAQRLP